jgi:Flp pilus assembly pilin Flp
VRASGRRFRQIARRDDGVAAVEFALVAPILILLVVGMLEFAFVMRDNIAVSSAVRTGVRTAATGAGNGCVQGSGSTCVPSLAIAAGNAMDKAGIGMPKGTIDSFIVYKANANGFPGSGTSMPAKGQCGVSASYPNCVEFTWDQTQNSGAGGFVRSNGFWNSSLINGCLPTPDQVGVFMRVNHPYMTRLFGATITVSDRAVMRFEPLPANSCSGGAHA